MQRELVAFLDSGGQIGTAINAVDKLSHWASWSDRLTKQSDLIGKFRLIPEIGNIAVLPQLSFVIHVPFRLQKPYISRDEQSFHLMDNPIRRDKIFCLPFVAATSWKGALRAAFWQLGHESAGPVIRRLFGRVNDTEEGDGKGAEAGRVHFYPTFFDKVGLEVINPHSRKSGVGARGPILMESVPQRNPGELFLLYVPFGATAGADLRGEVAQDLEVLAAGIQAMLTVYGFGAKTSLGFGSVEDTLAKKGTLAIRAVLPDFGVGSDASQFQKPTKPDLPRYLESPTRLHPEFRTPDGALKSEADYEKSRGGHYGKKEKQLYEKAKKWWDREVSLIAQRTAEPELPAPVRPPSLVTELSFAKLSELPDAARRLADRLRQAESV